MKARELFDRSVCLWLWGTKNQTKTKRHVEDVLIVIAQDRKLWGCGRIFGRRAEGSLRGKNTPCCWPSSKAKSRLIDAVLVTDIFLCLVTTCLSASQQVQCISKDRYFCLCPNLFEVHLSKPCQNCLPSSFIWFIGQQRFFFSLILWLTFQSTDTLLLRRLSGAKWPWHKGLHVHTEQSGRLQPGELHCVVGHVLEPLEQGKANSGIRDRLLEPTPTTNCRRKYKMETLLPPLLPLQVF